MVHAFDDAATLADRDYDVKVVIIKANGNGFCAGHAVGGGDPYPEFTENRERWDSVWKAQADLFLIPTQRLWEFRKPTIAQVHGYARGRHVLGVAPRHDDRVRRPRSSRCRSCRAWASPAARR